MSSLLEGGRQVVTFARQPALLQASCDAALCPTGYACHWCSPRWGSRKGDTPKSVHLSCQGWNGIESNLMGRYLHHRYQIELTSGEFDKVDL
jgi:hypothetical protein